MDLLRALALACLAACGSSNAANPETERSIALFQYDLDRLDLGAQCPDVRGAIGELRERANACAGRDDVALELYGALQHATVTLRRPCARALDEIRGIAASLCR